MFVELGTLIMQLQEAITIIERITLSSGCLSNTELRLATQLQQHTAEHTSVEEIQSFSISLVVLSLTPSTKSSDKTRLLSLISKLESCCS